MQHAVIAKPGSKMSQVQKLLTLQQIFFGHFQAISSMKHHIYIKCNYVNTFCLNLTLIFKENWYDVKSISSPKICGSA